MSDLGDGVPWLVRWAYVLWPVGLLVATAAGAAIGLRLRTWRRGAGAGAVVWVLATTVAGQAAVVTDHVDAHGVPRRPWLELGMLSPLHRGQLTLLVAQSLAAPVGPHSARRRRDLLELLDRSSSCDPRVVDWLMAFGAHRRAETRAERCQRPDAAGRAAWIEGELERASDIFLRFPPTTEAGWELATASHVLVGRWSDAEASLQAHLERVSDGAPPWRRLGLACVRDGVAALEGDHAAEMRLAEGLEADDAMVRSACGLLQLAVLPDDERLAVLREARYAPPLDWLRHLWLAAEQDASGDPGAAPFVSPIPDQAPFVAPPSGWIYAVATWDRALARKPTTDAERHHRAALATHRAAIAALLGDLDAAAHWIAVGPTDDAPAAIRDNWRAVATSVAVARGRSNRAVAIAEGAGPVAALAAAAAGKPLPERPTSAWERARIDATAAAAAGDGRPMRALLEAPPPSIEPWMTWVAPYVERDREAIANHLRYGPAADPHAGSLLLDTDLHQLTLRTRLATAVGAHDVATEAMKARRRFAAALQSDRRRGIVLAVLEAL